MKPQAKARSTWKGATRKKCSVCRITKPLTEFYWNNRGPTAKCKTCTRKDARERMRRNRSEGSDKQRLYDKVVGRADTIIRQRHRAEWERVFADELRKAKREVGR